MAQNQEKRAILLAFRCLFFANAQQAQNLTATSIVPAMTCGTTTEVL